VRVSVGPTRDLELDGLVREASGREPRRERERPSFAGSDRVEQSGTTAEVAQI
jgi:hypothetical protein